MKAYLWHLRNGGERWLQQGDRFSAVRLGDEDRRIELPDHPELDGLGCVVPARCERQNCSCIFPAEFKYCPFCGEQLHRLPVSSDLKDDLYRWSGRGFPEVSFILRWSEEANPYPDSDHISRFNLSLPEGSNFTFVVAGQPERLFAFDRSNGVLWTRRVLNEWVKLGEMGNDGLPSWSTSNANCKEGFVLATYAASGWRIGWIAQPWRGKSPIDYANLNPGDRCLGGAGISDGLVVVPIARAGRIAVCWRSAGADSWKVSPVEDAPAARSDPSAGLADRTDLLGAPVSDAREDLFWAGVDGYLFCNPDKGRLKEARWKVWPEGQRGVPQHRPMIVAGQQSIYQLCVIESPSKTKYFESPNRQYFATRMSSLNVASGSTNFLSTHPVRGPFFSAGQSTFYENQRFLGAPWDRQDTDLIKPEGYSIIPLLVLGADNRAPLGRQLIYARGQLDEVPKGLLAVRPSEDFKVDIVLTGQGISDGSQVVLERHVPIRSQFDLSLFFFGDALHLYIRTDNRLYRWPLRCEKTA